jgi:UDP-N-acetylmuramate: L-alanyl-gamma-D-glutamyl-meso-diaminopimelate ligase
MGGLAIVARQLGHKVTGSDANVYPPMSTQLREQGIALHEGYDTAQFANKPDLVIIGNALSRGNPAVEYVLERGLPYTSGPQWLSDQALAGRWVLACAGTHGKTTCSSMLAWILEYAGYEPGFLIGGVPGNFGLSARLGGGSFFVIEADEYDSAFFDKRSKFVHYRPRTLILNNLEFDHADIFPDLAAIQRQFHHLVRTVPGSGRIVMPAGDPNLEAVINQGCWSETETFAVDGDGQWQARLRKPDGSHFDVLLDGEVAGTTQWTLRGRHNVHNGLAAIASARHVGVTPAQACAALSRFAGVKRRLELLGRPRDIAIYDDFAHHPTAIATTLEGLRASIGKAPLIAVIEPRSNTMRLGTHLQQLAPSTRAADRVIWYRPAGLEWPLEEVVAASEGRAELAQSIEGIIESLAMTLRGGEHVVIMSNGGFAGIHQRLLTRLATV